MPSWKDDANPRSRTRRSTPDDGSWIDIDETDLTWTHGSDAEYTWRRENDDRKTSFSHDTYSTEYDVHGTEDDAYDESESPRQPRDRGRVRASWTENLHAVLTSPRATIIIAAFVVLALGGALAFSASLKNRGEDPVEATDQADYPDDFVGEQPKNMFQSLEQETTITFAFAGDCTLGRDESMDYDVSFDAFFDVYGAAYFFEHVKPIFDKADMAIVDLEGTLTTQTEREPKAFAFKGPPEFVQVLTSGGVDAVTIGNNHTADYGPDSYTETIDILRANQIEVFGNDIVAVVDVLGVKVGLVGPHAEFDSLGDPDQMVAGIEEARNAGAHVVIVFYHWGEEMTYEASANQVILARTAVDAGADLVVGCHVHRIQSVDSYNDTMIVYGLGNFSFGGNSNPTDQDAIIYEHSFTLATNGEIVKQSYRITPVLISSESWRNNYQPIPAQGDEKYRIQEKLQQLSPKLDLVFAD